MPKKIKYKRSARGLLSDLFTRAAPRRARRRKMAKKSTTFPGWK